jgi:hypothetical protein
MTVITEIGGEGEEYPSPLPGDRYRRHQQLRVELNARRALCQPRRHEAYILTSLARLASGRCKRTLGAFPEPTSTEKAGIYRRAYQGAVLEQPGICLGSYVFYWGQKQEVTSTWFSMLLRDGSRLGAADAMSELWTGKPPANRAPAIASLEISGRTSGKAGGMIEAILTTSDSENDPLRAEWLLQRDPEVFGIGGDREEEPPVFNEAIIRADPVARGFNCRTKLSLQAVRCRAEQPWRGGNGQHSVRVNGRQRHGPPAALPFTVYSEAAEPSGFIRRVGWGTQGN